MPGFLTSKNIFRIRNWRSLQQMRRADATCALTRWQHFYVSEIMPWPPSWKCDVQWKIRLRQSTHIYSKNNEWGQISSLSDLKRQSLEFFWSGRPNDKNRNKKKKKTNNMSSYNEISSWSKNQLHVTVIQLKKHCLCALSLNSFSILARRSLIACNSYEPILMVSECILSISFTRAASSGSNRLMRFSSAVMAMPRLWLSPVYTGRW